VLGVSGLEAGASHFKLAISMSGGMEPVESNLKSVMASGGD